MVELIAGLLLKALVVLVVAKIVPGVRVSGGYGSAIAVAVVYAILSTLLLKVLVFLSLPFIIVTFGLFLLVLNAFLLWLTDKILKNFEIRGLPSLAIATIGITLGNIFVNRVLNWIF